MNKHRLINWSQSSETWLFKLLLLTGWNKNLQQHRSHWFGSPIIFNRFTLRRRRNWWTKATQKPVWMVLLKRWWLIVGISTLKNHYLYNNSFSNVEMLTVIKHCINIDCSTSTKTNQSDQNIELMPLAIWAGWVPTAPRPPSHHPDPPNYSKRKRQLHQLLDIHNQNPKQTPMLFGPKQTILHGRLSELCNWPETEENVDYVQTQRPQPGLREADTDRRGPERTGWVGSVHTDRWRERETGLSRLRTDLQRYCPPSLSVFLSPGAGHPQRETLIIIIKIQVLKIINR